VLFRSKPGTVVVDPGQRFLYLTMADGRAIRYGIGVGRQGFAWSGQAVVGAKQKWPRFSDFVDGKPILLLQNGEWQVSSMKQSHIEDMDVMAAAREKNVRSLDQIKYAVLERNGSISIIKKKS